MRALFLPLLLAGLGCSEAETTPTATTVVSVEPARMESLSDHILASAVLESAVWQPLYFQTSGVVAKVAFEEGAEVRKGRMLARLDTDLQENQVDLNELAVTTATLDLEQAEHRLGQARITAKTGSTSPEEVYEREQQVVEARHNLEQQQLDLKGAQIKLEQMILRAPFDGVISELNIRVGEQVQGDVTDPDNDMNTRPPLSMMKPGAFTARVSLTEGQVRHVSPGASADFQLMEDASVQFPGTVEWVAPSVDRDSRTVALRLEAQLSPEDAAFARVRDGATARVEIHSVAGVESVTVPEKALLYHDDRAYVLRVQDGRVERLPVEQGVVRGGRVEVAGELLAGDAVVLTQVYTLKDGQAVEARVP